MISPVKKEANTESKINSRMLIISILFFIPSATLFYSALQTQGLELDFVSKQLTGYIALVFFLLIYIGLIKFITWFFTKMGINWK